MVDYTHNPNSILIWLKSSDCLTDTLLVWLVGFGQIPNNLTFCGTRWEETVFFWKNTALPKTMQTYGSKDK